ncbi:MAG: lysylphosphatidylglycerol synthase domain-containing protein, partial [Gaiella sp.]
ALAIFGFALTQNVLPGLDVLPSLPTFDYAWLAEQGRWSVLGLAVLAVLAVLGLLWVWRRWSEFKARVAQAFAVLRPPSRYLRTVVGWQLADWSLRLVTVWCFLGAFGIDQSLRTVLLVQATASLATLVPATPGGIGTEQALVVYALRGTEAARSTLLAFSVGMKLTLTVVNVVIGFTAILLTLGSFRFRHVVSEDVTTPPAA